MDNRKVVVRKTKKYGRAVFARKKIRKGEVIAVFDGPIYDDIFVGWTKDIIDHAIQFDKAQWRDSTGIARYINHSCEANCGIKKLFSVVAMRTILPGEEITWDYEMTEKNLWWKLRCRCGSATCRRTIGNYKNMPQKKRDAYKGYISEWLTK
jgi:uncharacterized protein